MDDGELNISVFPEGSRIRMGAKVMPKIASGEHVNDPEISYFSGKKIKIGSNPPAVIDLDGDLVGTTTASIMVCPQAMKIMTLDLENERTV
jgi:diacylglycerol kinase (ATP)